MLEYLLGAPLPNSGRQHALTPQILLKLVKPFFFFFFFSVFFFYY